MIGGFLRGPGVGTFPWEVRDRSWSKGFTHFGEALMRISFKKICCFWSFAQMGSKMPTDNEF